MSRLPSLFAMLALVGCESNLITNEPLPHVDAGLFARDAGKNTRRDAKVVEEEEDPEPGEQTDDDEPPPEDEVDASTSEPEEDSSTPAEGDAGTEPEQPMESKIKGTGIASKCLSYGLAKGDMCAGYYCGITVEDLAAEFKGSAKCAAATPEKICDGQLTRDVAKCAREVKSNPFNAADTEDMIREKVKACVLRIAANKDTGDECLDCFLDAAQCASDNCLTQCLTGDSATCDKCRMDNNCNQPVPTCAGFPSPF